MNAYIVTTAAIFSIVFAFMFMPVGFALVFSTALAFIGALAGVAVITGKGFLGSSYSYNQTTAPEKSPDQDQAQNLKSSAKEYLAACSISSWVANEFA